MMFRPTSIPGAFLLELEKREDSRGFFARSWCALEAEAHGLDSRLVQCNVSFNQCRGTLLGLHLQGPPHGEVKLVRCTRGALMDVLVDLRPDSPMFMKWEAFDLTQENRTSVYIPQGVAHGFQTLADETEIFYQMSEAYHPESAQGYRWNDPAFGVTWPVTPPIVSPRDAAFPLYLR